MEQNEYSIQLLENIDDRRSSSKRDICIFSPVGNIEQMDGYLKLINKLGIENSDNTDFFFIYRKGLKYLETGFSTINATEKYPLGTSGCFFLGQAFAYEQGYKTIIVADLDSFLDSKATLENMIKKSVNEKIAVLPRVKIETNKSDISSNVNNWGVFPREIFEQVGFSTPYLWKGSEDFEFFERLSNANKLMIYKEGSTAHHFSGFTVYHKMAEKKKYYPYTNGTLKALLFAGEYKKIHYVRYILFHVYYSFFADMFNDRQLTKRLEFANKLIIMPNEEFIPNTAFTINKTRETGSFSNLSTGRIMHIPKSIIELLLFKKYEIYTDTIILTESRLVFLAGILMASMLVPIRTIQALVNLAAWQSEKKKTIFPVFPSNQRDAEDIFLKLTRDKKL